MLHLQGNLQNVFDALYDLGVIEPVLKMDWRTGLEEIDSRSTNLTRAIGVVNAFGADPSRLRMELKKLDRSSLEVLAMEVAREYADFHVQHEVH